MAEETVPQVSEDGQQAASPIKATLSYASVLKSPAQEAEPTDDGVVCTAPKNKVVPHIQKDSSPTSGLVNEKTPKILTNGVSNQKTVKNKLKAANCETKSPARQTSITERGDHCPPKDCGGDGPVEEALQLREFLCACKNSDGCVTLKDILKSFNAPISEEQAWALIYQTIKVYRDAYRRDDFRLKDLCVPEDVENLCVHNDGSVHISNGGSDAASCTVTSHKKILMQVGLVVYTALDYNLQADEECLISHDLEQLISHMTVEDVDDEGIERDSEYDEEEKSNDTKELDNILELCTPRVQPAVPEEHYKAVCRALATESLELRVFLQKVFHGDTESLRLKADAQTSKQELAKLGFSDWARFWMQVVDELRRGVRLKKSNFSRTPVEYELTPYEILMEDIRARKYNLRKVMVNGDIPPRVKKDAHAVILEFIRSRPPLKKASDRKLPPPIKRTPSPREQLMDSIRKGRTLRPTQTRLKNRLLPTSHQQTPQHQQPQIEQLKKEESSQNQSPRSRQRLIKVDFSLLQQDDELWNLPPSGSTSQLPHQSNLNSSLIYNNENNPNNINTVLRRTKNPENTITHDEYHRFCDNALESYDLATQCESRRASMRRHTIVGCQSNISETHSMPPSRPDSRQSDNKQTRQKQPQSVSKQPQNLCCDQENGGISNGLGSNNSSNLPSMESWTKNSLDALDEKHWAERISDRLSLTLEEIVHIRSVMTKAELEGLPVGVRIKEDVERRKVCFLCLRTRFSIFGPWGVQCKLCQRTVCSKCYTKMRIPTEHFRNVPVVLLSPSLLNSPTGSNAPSPSHHAHNSASSSTTGPTSLTDESFPKSLMERLLRPESGRKTRNTVGSAPSSPKHQRSTTSTPGSTTAVQSDLHQQLMAKSLHVSGHNAESLSTNGGVLSANNNMLNNKDNNTSASITSSTSSYMNGQAAAVNRNLIMSRSMEGPKSLPVQSPARPHSNSSTLERKNRFARAFTLSSSAHLADQKENTIRGELMAVCNDCRGLVLEIIRSSRQTRSSARNRALKNLTLDLSPVYKRW
ncbi:unnamed protein product [Hermetia illucens]|uniref:Protein spire n=1 Tax=Hermetia illucens TaxID=343691 RepID=A0A7R8UFF6_HERIL|nr:unnamed protein product [Hermetia illucens]